MSNVLDGLEEAGTEIKDGAEHVGDTVKKAFGGQPEQPNPTQEAGPASPTDCGPTGCEVEEEPVRA